MPIRWLSAFIDRPADRFEESAAFWCAATASRLSSRRGERGQFATLLPPDGDAYLRVQQLGAQPRTHLDLHVVDVAAFADFAETLGAQRQVAGGANPTDELVVMRSPGGLPWCVVGWHGEQVRPAMVPLPAEFSRSPGSEAASTQGSSPTRPDSSQLNRAASQDATRVDQVCLDIPAAVWRRETAFWTELMGWPLQVGSRPEFAVLCPPEGLPLRLLLQRLNDPVSLECSAHLDLACSDPELARQWHESLGAEVDGREASWVRMRDPSRASYCLTSRNPATGRLESPPAAQRSTA